jgi:hypothetical protein
MVLLRMCCEWWLPRIKVPHQRAPARPYMPWSLTRNSLALV